MPRQPAPEKLAEYEKLKRFFVHWELHIAPNAYLSISEPGHPVNALARIEQEHSFSQALSGLKQAVNDNLESVEDWGPDQIGKADEALRKAGAPTLSELLVTRSRAFRRLLRRKLIRDDTEYYVVSAALSDTSAQRSPEESDLLGSMLAAYEARV
jgi:hypothetical protein